MVDMDGILKVAASVGGSAAVIERLLGKKRRVRNEIRENLELVGTIAASPAAVDLRSPSGWLQGQIAVDIARLAGHKLGTDKKPVPKGSVFLAVVLAAAFGGWTFLIVRDGFVWWAVFPGFAAFLFVVSVFGMFTDRDIPPEESNLPPGAVAIRSDTAAEQVAGSIAMAASEQMDDRWNEGMPIDVVMKFLDVAGSGDIDAIRAFCDDNLNHCRLLRWLYQFDSVLRDAGIDDPSGLTLESLPDDLRKPFLESEVSDFRGHFAGVDSEKWGAASRRRTLGPHHELVIVAPTPTTGGYWLPTATAVPNALKFVVSSTGGTWRIASLDAPAPPVPSWPPSWWVPMFEDDEVVPAHDDGSAGDEVEEQQDLISDEESLV
jgi:hypothetical protein